MAKNITDILKRPATEFEAPVPLPAGAYHCVVQGLPEQGESSKKKTPFFKWALTPLAQIDPDEEQTKALEAMGGLAEKVIYATFYITEDAVYRMREFLEHCGIESEGKSLEEMVDQSPNCEVIAYLRHTPSQRDENKVFAEFAGSAPVEQQAA